MRATARFTVVALIAVAHINRHLWSNRSSCCSIYSSSRRCCRSRDGRRSGARVRCRRGHAAERSGEGSTLQSATGAAELAVPAAAMSAEIRSTAAAAAATQEAFTAAIARVPARLLSPHAPCHLVRCSSFLAISHHPHVHAVQVHWAPLLLPSNPRDPHALILTTHQVSLVSRRLCLLSHRLRPFAAFASISDTSSLRLAGWPRLNRPQAQRSAHRLVDLLISLLACLCVVSTDPFTSQVKSWQENSAGIPCVSIQLTLSQTVWLVGTSKQLPSYYLACSACLLGRYLLCVDSTDPFANLCVDSTDPFANSPVC